MYEVVVFMLIILFSTTVLGFYLAYRYYKLNKINYHNSKTAYLVIGEYDKSFKAYMDSKQLSSSNNQLSPLMLLFESVIAHTKKYYDV